MMLIRLHYRDMGIETPVSHDQAFFSASLPHVQINSARKLHDTSFTLQPRKFIFIL